MCGPTARRAWTSASPWWAWVCSPPSDGERATASGGRPAFPALTRMRRGSVTMLRFTRPVLLAFALFAIWDAYSARNLWQDVLGRLFTPRLFLLLLLYIPWAMIQQTLFQFYLL